MGTFNAWGICKENRGAIITGVCKVYANLYINRSHFRLDRAEQGANLEANPAS